MSTRTAGTVLAERRKGTVTWQARISTDRGRLEVIGVVPASTTPTTIALLLEPELRELLGEGADLDEVKAKSIYINNLGGGH